ncbi:MAG: 2-nitropropane dioxygenase, partial [Anaerolineaceae bacterium]|nr:2-nitropropane dioxygenase [Anaerolineaceae bacterium]
MSLKRISFEEKFGKRNGKINPFHNLPWIGSKDLLLDDAEKVKSLLSAIDQPIWVVLDNGDAFITEKEGYLTTENTHSSSFERYGFIPAMPIESFGDPTFMQTYGTRFALYGGAMANAIASVEMVIAMGKAGMMCSYGSAGVSPTRVEDAIQRIQKELPEGPYAINLIHSPNEPSLERRLVDLYLNYEIKVIEASAYMDLTYGLVHYRVAGLSRASDGSIIIGNHIIAKISRKEVARKFMMPPSEDLLKQLLV